MQLTTALYRNRKESEFSVKMTDAVPVAAITLDLDDQEGEYDPFTASTLWIEGISVCFLLAGVLLGASFLGDWFVSSDRIFATLGVVLGLTFGLARAQWKGFPSSWRIIYAIVAWSIAAVLLLASLVAGGGTATRLPLVAGGLAFSAWAAIRIRGESVPFALSLGLAIAFPAWLEEIGSWGVFSWLESIAVSMTSGLADITGLSNIREENENAIFFEHGVGKRFSCVGTWDSLISFLGVAVCCGLARRRNLVTFIANCLCTLFVWVSIRSVAWCVLLHLGVQEGTWYEWTFAIELGCFFLGALMVISIDALLSAIFQPIPFEFVNLDFPLFALGWNWFCGLPKLTIHVPQRETDFGPMEEDELVEEYVEFTYHAS
jgi:hypothetical protein